TRAMRRGLRHVTRLLVSRSARVVVPSARTKIGLVERYGADPARVDVVPLAPRPLPDVPAAREPRPHLLPLGPLEPRENWGRALAAQALALERGADVDLVLVGSRGWLQDDLLRRLAAAPRVRWERDASDVRLAALYRGATALVYPSLGEGFGLPIAEGMAA